MKAKNKCTWSHIWEIFTSYWFLNSDIALCCLAGNLIAVECHEKGLGCAVKVVLACSGGCGTRIPYASSQLALRSHGRSCVALATALCFLVYGNGYATYFKVLKMGLGMDVLAKSNFYRIIRIAYPHVKSILDGMCEKAKKKNEGERSNDSWKLEEVCYNIRWLLVDPRVPQSVLYFCYY